MKYLSTNQYTTTIWIRTFSCLKRTPQNCSFWYSPQALSEVFFKKNCPPQWHQALFDEEKERKGKRKRKRKARRTLGPAAWYPRELLQMTDGVKILLEKPAWQLPKIIHKPFNRLAAPSLHLSPHPQASSWLLPPTFPHQEDSPSAHMPVSGSRTNPAGHGDITQQEGGKGLQVSLLQNGKILSDAN